MMTKSTSPILYSYRRCPYAMRARMALKYAGIAVEIREISLKDKPQSMLAVSPKATVPVLVLADGTLLEESLDIMYWALQQNDKDGWLGVDSERSQALVAENDSSFKQALDKYKYAIRFPEQPAETYRLQGEVFLQKLEALLNQNSYLLADHISLADVAIFPFIRQFSGVDSVWFETAPYPKLKHWLQGLIASELFQSIMEKQPTYLD
jgi:glutathione S-transferase